MLYCEFYSYSFLISNKKTIALPIEDIIYDPLKCIVFSF